jgi:uncharacterized peroxidase-related enzyme
MIFACLPADAGVRHALQIHPEAGEALCRYHQIILRGPSPLTVAERELIAAFVSGLNSCGFCFGTHLATAEAFGCDGEIIRRLVNDPGLRDADPRLWPILRYARKLTLAHAQIEPADAEAVFAAGWSERALHDLILVVAMFNFMNRFVHGHGIEGDASTHAERGRWLHDHGYVGVLASLADPAPPTVFQ